MTTKEATESQTLQKTPEKKQDQPEYKVLARKYRPAHFKEMIGQEALVQTLSNALDSGRLAHAYMLHGIRGVGKTTTARIMARALNYGEKDAKPTSKFDELTDSCKMIIEGRHIDVIEMDAASRTGVDDIRDIIDGVQYPPTSARYKIYIIDEVHMLSKNAFNALLKTLEEPPAYVKFIFATTEIRKVPVTVLSRCQRFDLKRIDQKVLADYYETITQKEGAQAEREAIELIARAADGSARDGLSILDQAIALGEGKINVSQVRDMLGLADRSRILDLFEYLLCGRASEALDLVLQLYQSGADPAVIIQDLLDVCHVMSKIKTLPALATKTDLPEAERLKSVDLTSRLSIPVLTRVWQMLLKGVQEVHQAPNPQSALEMVLIRLLYTSDLPTPGDLVKMIKKGDVSINGAAPNLESSRNNAENSAQKKTELRAVAGSSHAIRQTGGQAVALRVVEEEVPNVAPILESPVLEPEEILDEEEGSEDNLVVMIPQNFQAMVSLFGQKKEILLETNLKSFVRLVHYEPGLLRIHPLPGAKDKLEKEIAQYLKQWTGRHWQVEIDRDSKGEETLSEQARLHKENRLQEARQSDEFQKIIQLFPNAELMDIEPFEDY